MTRQSTKQRGITLVEVMLTLAISTLLITTVLAGRNSVRSQAQFNDGVERIKETVLGVKSDANTGNNTTGKGTGAGYLTLGRVITFTKDSSAVAVSTLLCTANANLVCDPAKAIKLTDTATTELPWKIVYRSNDLSTNPSVSVLFTRNGANAEFAGYWYGGSVVDTSGTLSTYTGSANQMPIVLRFESPDGRGATVTVNPATGTVTRKVL